MPQGRRVVGNLNQFYLMGRVTGSPQITEAERGPVAEISVVPGSSGRGPRGGSPLRFQAAGPQLEPAKALKEGDAVLLRGQLRHEPVEGSEEGRLIAWVQAIEHLSGDGRSSSGGGGGGESGSRPRRKRRRRGGRRSEGGEGGEGREGGEAPAGEGGEGEGGEAPTGEGGEAHTGEGGEPKPRRRERPRRERAPDPTEQLPPHRPVAEAPQAAPAPDPSYQKDMPF